MYTVWVHIQARGGGMGAHTGWRRRYSRYGCTHTGWRWRWLPRSGGRDICARSGARSDITRSHISYESRAKSPSGQEQDAEYSRFTVHKNTRSLTLSKNRSVEQYMYKLTFDNSARFLLVLRFTAYLRYPGESYQFKTYLVKQARVSLSRV